MRPLVLKYKGKKTDAKIKKVRLLNTIGVGNKKGYQNGTNCRTVFRPLL
jgi:hypothetical protein